MKQRLQMLDSLITGFMIYGMYSLLVAVLNNFEEDVKKEFRLEISIAAIIVFMGILFLGFLTNLLVEFITRV